MTKTHFDKRYYDRFYRNRKTCVTTPASTARLAAFVAAYLKLMRVPVRRILDVGCGLGYWQAPLLEHFPRARYHGVEISDYLCKKYGWKKGSIVNFESPQPFDLVICQGVLQYLNDSEARRAIDNLAELCRGAVYLEALTRDDWDENCDRDTTDGSVHLRAGAFYRRRLAKNFINCGGGVFVADTAGVSLFELERLD